GRLAPMRCVRRPAARQHPLPDARISGGEVSWRSLQECSGTAVATRLSLTTLESTLECSPADSTSVAAEVSGIRHVPPTAPRLGYIKSAEGATTASGPARRKPMPALGPPIG